MKEFIYLDTDYLTSALSQINKGKILTFVSESSDVSQEGTTNTSENSNSGGFGLNAIIKAGAGNTKSAKDENSIMDISSFKEVITKSFDDYAYDILYNYVNDSNQLNSSNNPASFILRQGDFKLIDFDFLDTMLENDFIELYIADDISNYEASVNRDARRDGSVANFKKNKIRTYTDIRDKLRTLRKATPGDMIMTMDNIIAPINKNYLRDNYKDISFKYKSVSMFAMITKKMDKTLYDGAEILLHAIDQLLPSLLQTFGVEVTSETLVVTPIAIYIE